MAIEVLLPRQGNTVESCIILEWRADEGAALKKGDVLCEVETDKATFEIEAPEDGILLKKLFPEGAEVPVLTLMAVMGEAGEDISALTGGTAGGAAGGAVNPLADAGAETEGAATRETEDPAGSSNAGADTGRSTDAQASVQAGKTEKTVDPSGFIPVSPRARNLAKDENLDYADLAGTGPDGRIIERDVRAALDQRGLLTPAARDALKPGQIPAAGTGMGGRILKADLGAAAPAVSAAAVTPDEKFPGAVESIAVRSIRKIVAERMHASLSGTAQLTLNASASAVSILAYREKCKASQDEVIRGITLNDFCLFAVTRSLLQYPAMNAHFLGQTINQFKHVHLGFAVDTPKGLMVPVIRYAETLSLRQISQEAKRLSTACMNGTIAPDLLSGGTFTVTNLGALGVESFTPVLNAPEVGIMGICAITPRPVLKNNEAVFVPHIGLSLTFNHQGIDGAPAARFLKTFSEMLANFELTLAG